MLKMEWVKLVVGGSYKGFLPAEAGSIDTGMNPLNLALI